MPTNRTDMAKPVKIPVHNIHFFEPVFKNLIDGYRLIETVDRNIISFGLKKLCPNNLGCKLYIRDARRAFLLESKISLEKKKKIRIPTKWIMKVNL